MLGGAEARTEAVSPEQAAARARALIAGGLRTKDAVKQAAEETGVAKNTLYALVVAEQ